jgi:hypothetical protein
MCVSNFTTSLPIYFGHEWTPDYPVMEAVGGSMSIPPAIRPTYTEGNVVNNDDQKQIPFIKRSDGKFELADYYFYQHIVKLALQKEIEGDKLTSGVQINVNNLIDVTTFLPKLRSIVNGEYDIDENTQKVKGTFAPDKAKTTTVTVGGVDYKVDYDLYRYYYNAAYKGMLMDGGYRNNIPYNFFRFRNSNIDKVLAIKLDYQFPPDLMNDLMNKIKDRLNDVEFTEIIEHFETKRISAEEAESGIPIETVVTIETHKFKVKMKDIVAQAKLLFDAHLKKWEMEATEDVRNSRRDIRRQVARNEKSIEKLVLDTLKSYRKKQLGPPWAHAVGLTQIAVDGYYYGAEMNQVRQVSDHNHIINLYDYGVGLYDFDLKKVLPRKLLSVAMAKRDTLKYFD